MYYFLVFIGKITLDLRRKNTKKSRQTTRFYALYYNF